MNRFILPILMLLRLNPPFPLDEMFGGGEVGGDDAEERRWGREAKYSSSREKKVS